MTEPDPYSPPIAELSRPQDDTEPPPPIWNPDAAGVWSLLFTPVFGSYLVYKNWISIGEAQRIRTAKIWFIVSLIMLLPYMVVPALGMLYIIVWYFGSQRKQTKYVRERWGKTYPKRKWSKPLLVAFSIVITLYIVVFLLVAGFAPEALAGGA